MLNLYTAPNQPHMQAPNTSTWHTDSKNNNNNNQNSDMPIFPLDAETSALYDMTFGDYTLDTEQSSKSSYSATNVSVAPNTEAGSFSRGSTPGIKLPGTEVWQNGAETPTIKATSREYHSRAQNGSDRYNKQLDVKIPCANIGGQEVNAVINSRLKITQPRHKNESRLLENYAGITTSFDIPNGSLDISVIGKDDTKPFGTTHASAIRGRVSGQYILYDQNGHHIRVEGGFGDDSYVKTSYNNDCGIGVYTSYAHIGDKDHPVYTGGIEYNYGNWSAGVARDNHRWYGTFGYSAKF